MVTLDFEKLRPALFPRGFTQSQVDGLNGLIKEFVGLVVNPYWQAYMLATIYHETGQTMQPVTEWGKGAGKPYFPYYGRGYVQLTWLYNYIRMGKLVNANLAANPELALDAKIATTILISGMIRGMFTGRKLGDYFSDTVKDPVNARRIINGTDCATEIASYYNVFLTALGVS